MIHELRVNTVTGSAVWATPRGSDFAIPRHIRHYGYCILGDWQKSSDLMAEVIDHFEEHNPASHGTPIIGLPE